jgi:hypothetical protein
MPESTPTHVIKLSVDVYAYVGEDGVTQVVIWDQSAAPASVHLYDARPNADDAGAEVHGDEAADVIGVYQTDEYHPGWEFGC